MRRQLASDFFLLGHDEFSGQLTVNPELFCCGLAGAQLADLVLSGRLTVDEGRVLVADARGDGTDEVSAWVAANVRGQRVARSVRSWINALGEALYELVARRLVDDGVVARQPGARHLLRRGPDRFTVRDLSMPHPRGLLEHLLQTPKDFQLPAAVTAVLATIVGMDVASGPEIDHAQARALISDLESDLPPDLGAIAEGVRAAVDGVSLTVRR